MLFFLFLWMNFPLVIIGFVCGILYAFHQLTISRKFPLSKKVLTLSLKLAVYANLLSILPAVIIALLSYGTLVTPYIAALLIIMLWGWLYNSFHFKNKIDNLIIKESVLAAYALLIPIHYVLFLFFSYL